jgi:hypothetical protein
LIRRVRIPRARTPYVVANAIGAVLGIAAFSVGTGGLGGSAAGLAVVGGLLFIALWAASGQTKKTPAVAVGGAVVDFAATDDEGRPFALSSLSGKPFLLKFFRGHW